MASAKNAYRASNLLSRSWAHAPTPASASASAAWARPGRCTMVPMAPTAARRSLALCFSTTTRVRNAAAPAAAAADDKAAAAAATIPEAAPKSSCPPGTVLSGLNYFKGKTDPVALRDEEYPEWLWNCLEVVKSSSDEDADMGDEFSKSKKQRQLAAKRQREIDAQVASGDLAALAPKIPLHQQTLNLPVTAAEVEGPTAAAAAAAAASKPSEAPALQDALAAEKARRDLRVAMRKARRAKIKEDNYLRSM